MARAPFVQDPALDQVFMKDGSIISEMVSFSGIRPTDTVLEIGTGLGTLTEAILPFCRKVITIEADERLAGALERKFPDRGRVTLMQGNALGILFGHSVSFDVMISNPPYSISEPLVKALFSQRFRCAVMTLPSGFAGIIAAEPGSRQYSGLSLFAQAFFNVEKMLFVERDIWEPVPDTDSYVVRLTPREPGDERDALLRELALQEDKKLKNALREAIVSARGKTKRGARDAIGVLGVPGRLMEKKISQMTLNEIMDVLGRL